VHATTQQESRARFPDEPAERRGAIVLQDALFSERYPARRARSEASAARHLFAPGYVEVGGLISYGDQFCRQPAAGGRFTWTDLRARSRASCRSEQPTKLEIVHQRQDRQSAGLVIPQDLLLRADRLIDDPRARLCSSSTSAYCAALTCGAVLATGGVSLYAAHQEIRNASGSCCREGARRRGAHRQFVQEIERQSAGTLLPGRARRRPRACALDY